VLIRGAPSDEEEAFGMPERDDDIAVIEEELEPITQEQGEANPELLSDERAAAEGILDSEDPAGFAARELQAIEDLLADDAEGEADDEAGGAAPPISKHQKKALRLALTQKGVGETPAGSNDNIYSAHFGFGAQFWCADFVGWALDKTGNEDKEVPWGYPSAVKNILAWGQRNELLRHNPRKGDIFILKPHSHTGLVTSADGTRFTTIEGNTTGATGEAIYVASHERDNAGRDYLFVRFHF
jgi:CHAP domain